jgi:methylthioribose-1-phosphate isomerase
VALFVFLKLDSINMSSRHRAPSQAISPAAPEAGFPAESATVFSPLRRFRDGEQECVDVLDQNLLPYRRVWLRLNCLADAVTAISSMQVRGAPLIGAVAAYGVALGLWSDPGDRSLASVSAALFATRPTAVNLSWSLSRMCERLRMIPIAERRVAAWREADAIATEDAEQNRQIGEHGLALLRQLAAGSERRPDQPLQLMTHCNAGWLATVAHGTALAPIYAGKAARMHLHVWVSETRPRNQGLLTAWELFEAGVAHTLVADSVAGHLLLQKRVDAVIVGADRIAANGDVANKIGTSLKALAAKHQGVPFYVAAPSSSLDFSMVSGRDIPLEIRDGDELRIVSGLNRAGKPDSLRQAADFETVYNPAFDVTPAALVSGIITERGVVAANAAALERMFPEKAAASRVS